MRTASQQEAGLGLLIYAALVARPAGGGSFADAIRVVTSATAADDVPAEADESQQMRAVWVGGVEAILQDSVVGASVWWSVGGVTVRVIGPDGHAEPVLAVAKRVVVDDGGDPSATVIEGLPAGYELVVQDRETGYGGQAYRFELERRRADGHSGFLSVTVMRVHADARPEAWTLGEGVSFREVRRVRAAVGVSVRTFEYEGRSADIRTFMIGLVERPRVLVTVQGSIEDLESAVQIVEGLEEVSPEEWVALMPATPAPAPTPAATAMPLPLVTPPRTGFPPVAPRRSPP